MFRRKKHDDVNQEAVDAIHRAEADLAKVRAQEPEVTTLVTRLERRQRRNNFGLALEKAMGARGQ